MPVKTKITKKIEIKADEPVEMQEALHEDVVEKEATLAKAPTKRGCFFCQHKKEPEFTDSVTLRKFISDRSRIQPKIRTGVCSKHQRRLTRQIKYARHLALLPFVPSI